VGEDHGRTEGDESCDHPGDEMVRLNVAEPAHRLGIPEAGVRKRVQRGQIPYERDDGLLFVWVSPAETRRAESRDDEVAATARGRGINREIARTGKESTRASANPPEATRITPGAKTMTSTSASRAARSTKPKVRREITIGVGSAPFARRNVLCPRP